jgi:hypothetical protein
MRLDDRKSDPLSIAPGIKRACADIYNNVSQAMLARYWVIDDVIWARRELADLEMKEITHAIALYRSHRKGRGK